jgi:hypothetical protein
LAGIAAALTESVINFLYPSRPVVFNFFLHGSTDEISLQLFTPKVVGVKLKFYTIYNLYINKLNKLNQNNLLNSNIIQINIGA